MLQSLPVGCSSDPGNGAEGCNTGLRLVFCFPAIPFPNIISASPTSALGFQTHHQATGRPHLPTTLPALFFLRPALQAQPVPGYKAVMIQEEAKLCSFTQHKTCLCVKREGGGGRGKKGLDARETLNTVFL